MAFRKDQNPLIHLPAMRRYARTLSRSEEDADDLVHDALLHAYEGAGTFRPGASLRNWLLAIVRNRFYSHVRRRKAEAVHYKRLALLLTDRVAPGQEHQAYLRQIVTRFLQLPEQQREVLHLIGIEGLGYQEAATLLDVPVGTVMSRLSRARASLRALESEAQTTALRGLHIVGGKDDT